MKNLKRTIIGIMLAVGLIMLVAEATSGNIYDTLLIKAGGLSLFALIPTVWKMLRMDQDEQLNKFLDD